MAEAILESPIGPLFAAASERGLERLEFLDDTSHPNAGIVVSGFGSDILEATGAQLAQYFEGSRREFDLPLNPIGSTFQLRIWEAIRRIPYGEVLSYGELALAAGYPGAFRAAGSACGVNRIALIIPCHRVVAANRRIGGYGGGLTTKRRLLQLEGSLLTLRREQHTLALV